MRFDQYQSEEKAYKDGLIYALKGREDALMTLFIQQGPDEARKTLGVTRDQDWNIIFDYLVFSKKVLRRCVMQFLPFFKHLVRTKGPLALRDVLGIQDPMYDSVYEELFDFVAIAQGSLFEYVYAHADLFIGMIRKGKGRLIRLSLSLDQQKYDGMWGEVLEFLTQTFSSHTVSEEIFEHGLQAFDAMMNTIRSHRPLEEVAFVRQEDTESF